MQESVRSKEKANFRRRVSIRKAKVKRGITTSVNSSEHYRMDTVMTPQRPLQKVRLGTNDQLLLTPSVSKQVEKRPSHMSNASKITELLQLAESPAIGQQPLTSHKVDKSKRRKTVR